MKQITKNLLMVKPACFSSNNETLSSNEFQHSIKSNNRRDTIQNLALNEFHQLVKSLEASKICTYVYDDDRKYNNPDAVFPNNWISFHQNGSVILYPMMSLNRRKEKRTDILDDLVKKGFTIKEVIDLSYLENDDQFLEGTGSMIFDRPNKRAYACISSRTSYEALDAFSKITGYEVISFHTLTKIPIYHTNVMMSLGENTAFVCFDIIQEKNISEMLRSNLKSSGRAVIDITKKQMNLFLGNTLEVENFDNKKILLMSDSAHKSLSSEQLTILSERVSLLSFSIPTIEKYGGGSVRCMLAEIFLEKEHR